jgi:hypothetical protein
MMSIGDKSWQVSVKDARDTSDSRIGAFEVCAELTPHITSWGWFGRDKIRIEGMGFDESKRRAQVICDALNAYERGLTRAFYHD